MKTYYVVVSETVQRGFAVEAESEEAAIESWYNEAGGFPEDDDLYDSINFSAIALLDENKKTLREFV